MGQEDPGREGAQADTAQLEAADQGGEDEEHDRDLEDLGVWWDRLTGQPGPDGLDVRHALDAGQHEEHEQELEGSTHRVGGGDEGGGTGQGRDGSGQGHGEAGHGPCPVLARDRGGVAHGSHGPTRSLPSGAAPGGYFAPMVTLREGRRGSWRARVVSRVVARGPDPVLVVDLLQNAKTALAGVLAWVVALDVLGLDQPFLAPWAAVLVVHATVYRTVSRGGQQIVATFLGRPL